MERKELSEIDPSTNALGYFEIGQHMMLVLEDEFTITYAIPTEMGVGEIQSRKGYAS